MAVAEVPQQQVRHSVFRSMTGGLTRALGFLDIVNKIVDEAARISANLVKIFTALAAISVIIVNIATNFVSDKPGTFASSIKDGITNVGSSLVKTVVSQFVPPAAAPVSTPPRTTAPIKAVSGTLSVGDTDLIDAFQRQALLERLKSIIAAHLNDPGFPKDAYLTEFPPAGTPPIALSGADVAAQLTKLEAFIQAHINDKGFPAAQLTEVLASQTVTGAAAPVAAVPPAQPKEAPLFTYYEQTKVADELTAASQWRTPEGHVPSYDALKAGDVLIAASAVYLRTGPTTTAAATETLAANRCVEIVAKSRKLTTQELGGTLSGGWLEVEPVKCRI